MTRIIAGKFRGAQLLVPKKGTRPTSDKVREAVFSTLQARQACEQARVLDLFAGSGALAIEALSRGALAADLVEKSPAAGKNIGDNLKKYAIKNAKIHVKSAESFVQNLNENPQTSSVSSGWELVFIDPPYDYPTPQLAALLVELHAHLDPDAWVVVERSSRSDNVDLPENLYEKIALKDYGETRIFYYRPAVL